MRQPLVPFTMISAGGNFGQSMAELDPVPTGEQQAVPSGSASVNDGLFVQREESDNEEVREGPGVGMKRRESRRSETRSEALGEAIEMMQKPGVRRRSVNWQQRCAIWLSFSNHTLASSQYGDVRPLYSWIITCSRLNSYLPPPVGQCEVGAIPCKHCLVLVRGQCNVWVFALSQPM
jgi:hypothetical protein